MASYDDTATVSGSVVSIENGADEVGAKSCVVTVSPTLSGVSEVSATQTGKNLFNEDWEIGGINDTTGVPNSDTNKIRSKTFSQIKGGTTCYVGAPQNIRVLFYTSSETFISETANIKNASFSVPSNCALFKIRGTVDYGTTYNNDIIICYGSTAHAYEPYTTPTTHTASLGRTIYGGSADVVKGEGKDNCKKIALGDLTWIKSGTDGNFYCSQVTDIWYPSEGGISRYGIGVSDEFEFIQGVPTDGQINCYFNTAYSGYRIFIKKEDYADRTSAEFKEYLQNINAHLVYKVNEATETDFTFEPVEINSRLGYNAFWSEQGDTELTYYKSGYGFTSVMVHKETPEGEPVEETRKLHRIIYEGQVDVINGTGLIYRGESGTQYDPPEQISFTPIEVSTDDGENTLYADEGDSAITYRKAVD